MRMMTEKLTGKALDWAVAKCEGHDWMPGDVRFTGVYAPRYSTDWRQGGPIIEREEVFLVKSALGGWASSIYAHPDDPQEYRVRCTMYGGPTPLVAAMRCYVGAKLGGEVDVPEELI